MPFDGQKINYREVIAVPEAWTRYRGLIHHDPVLFFDVPTEVVLRSRADRLVVVQGRVYRTHHYDVGNGVLSSEVREVDGKRVCAYALHEVYAVEVWEDHGDDGHVEYRLDGLRFVSCQGNPELIVTCECGESHRLFRPWRCMEKLPEGHWARASSFGEFEFKSEE